VPNYSQISMPHSHTTKTIRQRKIKQNHVIQLSNTDKNKTKKKQNFLILRLKINHLNII